ncbi:MAG: L-serine ammonia-lyase, iron-sulfur-dependent, subunit alpha [Sphingobacteriales bacterium]|nr:L-serine ammonia-lyase, iron-sulfur-dependent, subunit alpha [Sphingobacteriales bacterium]
MPCIERNANGAIKAYNAYLLADGRTSRPVISFNQVVEVMRQTGEDLSAKYKETAKRRLGYLLWLGQYARQLI